MTLHTDKNGSRDRKSAIRERETSKVVAIGGGVEAKPTNNTIPAVTKAKRSRNVDATQPRAGVNRRPILTPYRRPILTPLG